MKSFLLCFENTGVVVKSSLLVRCLLLVTAMLTCHSNALASDCKYRDSRICVVDSLLLTHSLGHKVVYEEVGFGEIKSIAEAEWMIDQVDVIRLSNTDGYGINDLFFLMAHEFAHSFKKHSRVELERIAEEKDRNLTNRELFNKYGDPTDSPMEFYHSQELDADSFAVEFMLLHGKDPYRAIRNVIRNRSNSSTHPAKSVRLENAKTIIDKFRVDGSRADVRGIQKSPLNQTN